MSLWSQYFPPKPRLTESNLPSQAGKIFIITGGASGVGFELSSILYSAGAKVYIAGRSKENAQAAIAKIEKLYNQRVLSQGTSSAPAGTLSFLQLDLSDLSSVAPAAREFLRKETHLDVLWNNAGVGATFNGETSAQGIPIQLGTNCLGPLLFTQLLQPALEASDNARVVWTASAVVDSHAPKGGMLISDFEAPKQAGIYNYTASKVGNWFLASESAKREAARIAALASSADTAARGGLVPSPILHVAANPGNLRTAIWRQWGWLFVTLLSATLLYDARYGAYTALWAGLSPELDAKRDNGSYVVPWGRKHDKPRADILESLKSQEEGGTGVSAKFFEWCEKQIMDYR